MRIKKHNAMMRRKFSKRCPPRERGPNPAPDGPERTDAYYSLDKVTPPAPNPDNPGDEEC